MAPLERAVLRGGSHVAHQMNAPLPPTHLLLNIRSALQRPLHRALNRCRRYRCFASAGCGLVDHEIGLSGYVGLEIAQKTCHLAHGRDDWRRIVSRSTRRAQSFANEIERAPDLTVPQTLTDPPNGLGEASPGSTITLRGVRPTLGRLGDSLNPHREMKPVQNLTDRSRTGGFAEAPWPSTPSLRMATGVIDVAPRP
jgi:hypothetical protein